MNEVISRLLEECNSLSNEAQALTFPTRDTELQLAMTLRLAKFLDILAAEKENAVRLAQEADANLLLAIELSVQVVLHELKMWLALRGGDPDAAWEQLVDAQYRCADAIRIRQQVAPGFSIDGLQGLLQKLLVVERVAFPPQSFVSVGGVAHRCECSICSLEYGKCGHIKQRAYMGKVCCAVISQVALEEVSLVDRPANKRCRALSFVESGVRRDVMTWRTSTDDRSTTDPIDPSD